MVTSMAKSALLQVCNVMLLFGAVCCKQKSAMDKTEMCFEMQNLINVLIINRQDLVCYYYLTLSTNLFGRSMDVLRSC